MATQYTVKSIPLDTAEDQLTVVPNGQTVGDVYVQSLTGGAAATIQFGPSGGPDRQIACIEGMNIELCPPEPEGVFVSFGAQPGAVLELVVGYVTVNRL